MYRIRSQETTPPVRYSLTTAPLWPANNISDTPDITVTSCQVIAPPARYSLKTAPLWPTNDITDMSVVVSLGRFTVHLPYHKQSRLRRLEAFQQRQMELTEHYGTLDQLFHS